MASFSFLGLSVTTCDGPFPVFTPSLFFHILLPPIILDSAFTLYDRDFLSNIGTILTYAIFGTLFNTFSVGLSLYGVESVAGPILVCEGDNIPCRADSGAGGCPGNYTQHNLTLTETLIFSSLISAVDPVAVLGRSLVCLVKWIPSHFLQFLAIFEEIRVNTELYFLVFGESLLNDGVSVVLYNAMLGMSQLPAVTPLHVILVCLQFVFVVLGGFVIGVLGGAAVSFVTAHTHGSREVEPLLVFATAYISFVTAELVHWSGIISIIGFGVVVKRYAMVNVSKKSYTTIKYATRNVSSSCKTSKYQSPIISSVFSYI